MPLVYAIAFLTFLLSWLLYLILTLHQKFHQSPQRAVSPRSTLIRSVWPPKSRYALRTWRKCQSQRIAAGGRSTKDKTSSNAQRSRDKIDNPETSSAQVIGVLRESACHWRTLCYNILANDAALRDALKGWLATHDLLDSEATVQENADVENRLNLNCCAKYHGGSRCPGPDTDAGLPGAKQSPLLGSERRLKEVPKATDQSFPENAIPPVRAQSPDALAGSRPKKMEPAVAPAFMTEAQRRKMESGYETPLQFSPPTGTSSTSSSMHSGGDSPLLDTLRPRAGSYKPLLGPTAWPDHYRTDSIVQAAMVDDRRPSVARDEAMRSPEPMVDSSLTSKLSETPLTSAGSPIATREAEKQSPGFPPLPTIVQREIQKPTEAPLTSTAGSPIFVTKDEKRSTDFPPLPTRVQQQVEEAHSTVRSAIELEPAETTSYLPPQRSIIHKPRTEGSIRRKYRNSPFTRLLFRDTSRGMEITTFPDKAPNPLCHSPPEMGRNVDTEIDEFAAPHRPDGTLDDNWLENPDPDLKSQIPPVPSIFVQPATPISQTSSRLDPAGTKSQIPEAHHAMLFNFPETDDENDEIDESQDSTSSPSAILNVDWTQQATPELLTSENAPCGPAPEAPTLPEARSVIRSVSGNTGSIIAPDLSTIQNAPYDNAPTTDIKLCEAKQSPDIDSDGRSTSTTTGHAINASCSSISGDHLDSTTIGFDAEEETDTDKTGESLQQCWKAMESSPTLMLMQGADKSVWSSPRYPSPSSPNNKTDTEGIQPLSTAFEPLDSTRISPPRMSLVEAGSFMAIQTKRFPSIVETGSAPSLRLTFHSEDNHRPNPGSKPFPFMDEEDLAANSSYADSFNTCDNIPGRCFDEDALVWRELDAFDDALMSNVEETQSISRSFAPSASSAVSSVFPNKSHQGAPAFHLRFRHANVHCGRLESCPFSEVVAADAHSSLVADDQNVDSVHAGYIHECPHAYKGRIEVPAIEPWLAEARKTSFLELQKQHKNDYKEDPYITTSAYNDSIECADREFEISKLKSSTLDRPEDKTALEASEELAMPPPTHIKRKHMRAETEIFRDFSDSERESIDVLEKGDDVLLAEDANVPAEKSFETANVILLREQAKLGSERMTADNPSITVHFKTDSESIRAAAPLIQQVGPARSSRDRSSVKVRFEPEPVSDLSIPGSRSQETKASPDQLPPPDLNGHELVKQLANAHSGSIIAGKPVFALHLKSQGEGPEQIQHSELARSTANAVDSLECVRPSLKRRKDEETLVSMYEKSKRDENPSISLRFLRPDQQLSPTLLENAQLPFSQFETEALIEEAAHEAQNTDSYNRGIKRKLESPAPIAEPESDNTAEESSQSCEGSESGIPPVMKHFALVDSAEIFARFAESGRMPPRAHLHFKNARAEDYARFDTLRSSVNNAADRYDTLRSSVDNAADRFDTLRSSVANADPCDRELHSGFLDECAAGVHAPIEIPLLQRQTESITTRADDILPKLLSSGYEPASFQLRFISLKATDRESGLENSESVRTAKIASPSSNPTHFETVREKCQDRDPKLTLRFVDAESSKEDYITPDSSPLASYTTANSCDSGSAGDVVSLVDFVTPEKLESLLLENQKPTLKLVFREYDSPADYGVSDLMQKDPRRVEWSRLEGQRPRFDDFEPVHVGAVSHVPRWIVRGSPTSYQSLMLGDNLLTAQPYASDKTPKLQRSKKLHRCRSLVDVPAGVKNEVTAAGDTPVYRLRFHDAAPLKFTPTKSHLHHSLKPEPDTRNFESIKAGRLADTPTSQKFYQNSLSTFAEMTSLCEFSLSISESFNTEPSVQDYWVHTAKSVSRQNLAGSIRSAFPRTLGFKSKVERAPNLGLTFFSDWEGQDL